VLDPFMGSGTTAVAAVRAGRHFVGYDTDVAYCERAMERVAKERARRSGAEGLQLPLSFVPAKPASISDDNLFFQARSVREGKAAKDVARELLEDCGFRDIEEDVAIPGAGIELNFRAVDHAGDPWYFDVSGAFTSTRPGLKRTDTLWKALGKALVLSAAEPDARLILVTTDAPPRASAGDAALQQVRRAHPVLVDVIEMSDGDALSRLHHYAHEGRDG
jgi:hypothetical protein